MAKKKYKRQKVHTHKRLKEKWKKPRGSQSKMRKGKKGKPEMPKVGRRGPIAWRGKHPSGKNEFFVRNLHDLKRVNEKTEAIRISAAIGKKKKEDIIKKAEKKGLKILNP